EVPYPAETGASCSAWDEKNHPDCQGAKPAAWCKKAWCYVDPCECSLVVPPKTSAYLPKGVGNGKPIYFSYAACGADDEYTAGNEEACVNQEVETNCSKLEKCAWDVKQCLGKELVQLCSSAQSWASGFAVVTAAFGWSGREHWARMVAVEDDEDDEDDKDDKDDKEDEEEETRLYDHNMVLRTLADAIFQLQLVCFCASDTDAAGEAFTVFNRAVLWIVQSPEQEDDEVLSKMEEKESVLEFLADFHDRRPKHRARITQLCVRLLEFETWREALASSNPSVAATLHALTGLSAPVRASTAVNLETAAELAASRGCIGALYLRIVSAKALPKDGAAPFVRARLGGASGAGAAAQRTETAAGVAPRWDGTPFVFEVPNPDASITMEVLSSDETGDDLLGSASFKVLEKAPESSKMPKLISLSLSAGGSLDFEILFRAAKSGGWIVSGVKGGASGVGGLACPAGHPIDKRKEGMSWRQSFLQGETKLCNFCRSEIQRHETRWRCFHHCDFNVCEKCYREKAAQ
ncbi:unnamed protein product, partial [Cladocopium goreaui]